ncbi:hypothetical protein BJV82DRAFT_242838 [Fennellomyces sp. T-0311]|nr:hypothetical protein BJV82DRAFT_242838 [Fennellomyces sp. T-0311]
MPSHRFKNVSSGRTARSASHNFLSTFSAGPSYPYGNVYSSSDMTHVEESSVNDLAHIDKRSAHNALERQRRENLNSKFQQLAHALPSLQTVRRPSKTVIVAKSLEFVSSSVTRETKFQSQIEHLRRENERLRDQAIRNKQRPTTRQVSTTTTTVDGTVSSSSSASSLLEQPMYLSPDQLVLSNTSSIEQLAVGDASTTAATYSENTAQISPPPSPPTTTTTTSPKRKASLNFEVNNNNPKREKLSPKGVENVPSPDPQKKMRQNSTSSLDASFMMMMTSDAAPPPDQSAIAALAEQQQQQPRRSMQRVVDQCAFVRPQRASSAAGNMMPGFMLDQPNYYERTAVSQQQQQQQQQLMVNLTAAAAPPPFIDQPSAMMVNGGNYPMIGYSQPATTGYLPEAPAMAQYPLMNMPSVFPPPYFQHDPNHDYNAFHWS